MAVTLSDVLQGIGSYINQDPALASSTDLTSQVNLVNQAQNEWSDSYQWDALKIINYVPTFAYSLSSIGLPVNFKKLMSPVMDVSVDPPYKYLQIEPSERFKKISTDKYVVLAGNNVTGKYLLINPPLASGASIKFDFQSFPSSLVTTTDTVTCPSTQFLVLRAISKILSARSDPRFTLVKQDSDDILGNLMEEEAAPSGAENNQTRDYFREINFRIGND